MSNFLTFIPASGGLGTKVVTFNNTPEGMTVDINPERPFFGERMQNGDLITTSVDWNKDTIEVAGIFYDVLFDIYLKALFTSNVGFTLKVHYDDASFAEQELYDAATVFATRYRTSFDMVRNVFNINMSFREV